MQKNMIYEPGQLVLLKSTAGRPLIAMITAVGDDKISAWEPMRSFYHVYIISTKDQTTVPVEQIVKPINNFAK